MKGKLVREMFARFRVHIAVVLAFTAALQILAITTPYIQGRLIDYVIDHRPLRDTFGLIGLAFALGLVRIVLSYSKDRYEIKHVDFAVPRHVANRILERMLGFSIGQHAHENSGVKLSIMARGQSSITQLSNVVLFDIFPQVIGTLVLLGATCWMSPLLGSILTGGVIVYAALIAYDAWRAHKPLRKIENLRHAENKVRGEHVRHMSLVLRSAQEKRALAESDASYERFSSKARELWSRMIKKGAIRIVLLEVIRFTVIVLSVWLVYAGHYTPGFVVIFWSWSSTVLGNVTNLGRMNRMVIDLYIGARKYFEMAEIEPDVRQVENPVRLGKVRGEIVFENVTYTYPARKSRVEEEEEEIEDAVTSDSDNVPPTLHGVNLHVPAGSRIALVGESGAGKSTIVNLLLRAQDPQEGRILVDGYDLRLLDLTELRSAIGIVEQDVTLYDESIRYNLTYGLGDRAGLVQERDILRACRMARVDHFFGRLEKGLDTMIGERGIKLSGGEKQRVGIARALIKNPAILILDEATSNLDSENEKLIQSALEEAAEGRTTIVIAHRFSTIRNADRIYVVEQGRIVGEGSYAELAESCPQFQRLMHHQVFVH